MKRTNKIIFWLSIIFWITAIWISQYAFWWSIFSNNTYSQNIAWEEIPFDKTHHFNIERYDKELTLYKGDAAQAELIWKRFPLYKPMIDKKLKEAGLPSDLFYLAIVESALKETAGSSAWAVWIWQFMPATAKSYGLRVDDNIDERYNVEKETDAAIAYLKKAYDKFWNWTLAMASFNRGMNWIANDMNSQYQDSFYDLWLNTETSRYIFRIAASKEVFGNITRYFDTSKWWNQYTIPETKEITIWKTDNLAVWAASQWYTYAEIRYLNPRIRKNALPEWERKVKVYKR